ncbi:MAG: hypothetical protein HEEMFOPI_00180 [Holosporales bacterium]
MNVRILLCFLWSNLLLATPVGVEKKVQALFKKDTWIATQDKQLNELYATVREFVSDKKKLIDDQRKWIALRNEHINDVSKIYALYISRLNELKNTPELKDFLRMFLNGNKTIDLKDPVLLEKLQKCQLQRCKIYKVYFDYQNSDDKKESSKKTIDELHKILPQLNIENIKTVEDFMVRIPFELVEKNIPDEFEGVPFWLFDCNRKSYFDVGNQYYRRSITIISDVKFDEDLSFGSIIRTMFEGRFITTSYLQHQGTIQIDLAIARYNYLQSILYAPETLAHNRSVEEYHYGLFAWSLSGIYNQLTYKRFLKEFKKATEELKKFYQTVSQRPDFVDKAELLLASYIDFVFPNSDSSLHKVCDVIRKTNKDDLSTLKQVAKDFTKEEKNILLHALILADFFDDAIDWLLEDKDININHKYKDETFLMNAVTRPTVLKKLIVKKADVNASNCFGKTALFYAVQFSDLESVKLIVEHGANVNASIDSLMLIKKRYDKEYHCDYLPEKVADFTPLVYAMRYAKQDVRDYLMAQGATQGCADQKRISDWVEDAKKSHL